MHVLGLGQTLTGKTYLFQSICRNYKTLGVDTIVLDPINDPAWGATFMTTDQAEFLRVAKLSEQCALFVDESGIAIGRYAGAMSWAATTARHWGHKSHFIAHRLTQLDKTVRDQCSILYIFRVSKSDAKTLADDFGHDELGRAAALPPYYFYKTDPFFNISLLTLGE